MTGALVKVLYVAVYTSSVRQSSLCTRVVWHGMSPSSCQQMGPVTGELQCHVQ